MRVGDVIDGKYRIDRQIGEGGMGEVFEVTHVKLGKKYAIKVVRESALSSPGIAERFAREARAASNLESDHVAKVIDVGELPSGAPYMLMELLQGRDLERILMQGPLQVPIAVDFILQACEALAEAHARGMVHRDIKPANMFIADRPNGTTILKLLDFGIATAQGNEVSSLTNTNMVMGSPQFMSPEQLRSSKVVDARADIWALGVTLYVLLACRIPFDGKVFSELSIQIATEPHLRLNFVPPQLADVIDRCMAKSPDARYSNVAELAFALAPFTANGVAAAQRVQSLLKGGSGAYPPLRTGPQASATPVPYPIQTPPVGAVPNAGVGYAETQATDSGFVPGKPTTLGASAAQQMPRVKGKGSPLKWIAPLVLLAGGGGGAAIVLSQNRTAPDVPKAAATDTVADTRSAVAPPQPTPPQPTTSTTAAAPAADAAPELIPTPVAIEFKPSKTTITIDGQAYVNPIDQIVMLAGPTKLLASLDGYEPLEIMLSPGGTRRPQVIELTRIKKARPATSATSTSQPKGDKAGRTQSTADDKRPGYQGIQGNLQTDIFDQPAPAPKK